MHNQRPGRSQSTGSPIYRLNLGKARTNTHALLVEYANGAKEVLDVGCASGYLAAELSRTGAVVDGIELDASAAQLARSTCRHVSEGSASDPAVWTASAGVYDAIIFGDVLEHLPDPPAALGLALRHLAPGGRLIVSLPNVAEVGLRALHLSGRWDYRDSGAMDRTHLRWFTLRTSREMFAAAGLRVERFSGASGGPRPPFLITLRPQLFAPQFVFDLRPLTP